MSEWKRSGITILIFTSDIYCKNLTNVFFLNMIHETTTGSNPPQAPPNPSNPNVPGSILIREMGWGIRTITIIVYVKSIGNLYDLIIISFVVCNDYAPQCQSMKQTCIQYNMQCCESDENMRKVCKKTCGLCGKNKLMILNRNTAENTSNKLVMFCSQ